jgi:hypothetical protein
MKIASYSLQATPNKHQVAHVLMSCLFDPEQVALGGLYLGCRHVLSFDAKPIPGLGLLHRTHWGNLIGVGVAIGIGIESAHR